MGTTPSVQQHIVLHQWRNPKIEHKVARIPVRLTLDGLEHEDASQVTLKFNKPQLLDPLPHDLKAVFLRIKLFWVDNEFDKDILVDLRYLFPPTKDSLNLHPDYTGKIQIFCPAKTAQETKGIDSILYRPNELKDETIEKYAGLEDAILGNRTKSMPASDSEEQVVEVFEQDEPLIEFITSTPPETIKKDDVEIMDNGKFYKFKPEFLAYIRGVFKDSVFSDIRYTRFEEMKLHCDLPKSIQQEFYRLYKGQANTPSCYFVLDFYYIIVGPGELKLRHKETQLK